MSTGTAAYTTEVANPFEITAGSGGGDFQVCPKGNYPAVIVGAIDLGTHATSYKDQKTGAVREGEARKGVLLIQIGTQYAKQTNGDPFIFAFGFSKAGGPNARARQVYESITGKTLGDKEVFNPYTLIGKSCTANIVEAKTSNGKDVANLEGLTALTMGVPLVDPACPIISWWHGKGDFPDHSWLPWSYGQKLVDIYKDSKEYRAIHGGPAGGADVAPMTATGQTPTVTAGVPDEDIPF